MMETPEPPPVWMPSGGRGALLFWGGLCALLAFGLVWVYGTFLSQEKADRLLRDQQQILTMENQQLRSQIDTLQGQLSQEGNALRNREQVLQAATQTLQAVQSQTEQQGQQSAASRQAQAALQLALTKAFLSQDGLTIWNEQETIHVRILDSALFDGSDVLLSAKGDALAHKLAGVLKAAPSNEEVLVESFMDNPPVGAKAAALFNPWEVSVRRGGALAHVLTEAVDPGRIALRSYGSMRPLVASEGADRYKNRRLDLTLQLK